MIKRPNGGYDGAADPENIFNDYNPAWFVPDEDPFAPPVRRRPLIKKPKQESATTTREVPRRQAWFQSVIDPDGPPDHVQRVILMAVCRHMRLDGTGARPGIRRIAACAHVTVTTAIKHLRRSVQQGWLKRHRNVRDDGTLGSYVYEVGFPPKRREGGALAARAGAPNDHD